jgi:hypothetical protein
MFHQIAESEGQDFDQVLGAMQRDQESFPATEEMYELEARFWEAFQSCRPELGGATPHAQLIAWAWVAQLFRQAHTVFRLVAEGFPDSACANARSAFEHGIYVSVLADSPDVDFVLDRLERRYIEVGRELAKSGTAAEEDALSLLADMLEKWSALTSDMDSSSTWVHRMQRVCDHLVDGDTIYGHYRGLSTQMHCGFGSAEGFMVAAFGAGTPEDPVLTHEPVIYATKLILWGSLGACAWAGWAADKLFGFDHFASVSDLLRPQGFEPLRLLENLDR